MDDTHPDISSEMRRRLMQLPGETRILMGSRMFDACRDMAIASFPDNLSESEIKAAILIRFYGKDLEEKWLKEILGMIRKKEIDKRE